jgi:hypothetical protein
VAAIAAIEQTQGRLPSGPVDPGGLRSLRGGF